MEDRTRVIKIESIFGGKALYSNFPGADQYYDAYAIDPEPDGFINPQTSSRFTGETITGYPYWIKREPKVGNYYVYDSVGSVYSLNNSTITAVGDLNDDGSAAGNGLEYYDNYLYFARATTIARYGPLNGTASFTDDYWVGTLSKTALTNTTYPDSLGVGPRLPNHVMHRGRNGSLYVADVVGNQGVLHRITTSKTTVEGDTDNGSSYNVIDFPYGYWPTAIEGYGEEIVTALFDGAGSITSGLGRQRAKLAFWDPTNPETYSKMIDWEFPDSLIIGLKNTNGILYVLSAFTVGSDDFIRVSRYVGGYSFEQVGVIASDSSLPGAIDGKFNRIVFGGTNGNGCVYSVGLEKGAISNSIFSIRGCTNTTQATTALVTALAFTDGSEIIRGWGTQLGGVGGFGIDGSNSYAGVDNYVHSASWTSKLFVIGQKFQVKKVSIPINGIRTTSSITATLYFDSDGDDWPSTTLGVISSANYGTDARRIVFRPNSAIGYNRFSLELVWAAFQTQADQDSIGLPITIEIELLDD